ncbi:MerR family transcriptional regulator [Candidatus Babeliales bacterium]|nr:MerR family transcriptional regulator [Candidatus Babeliales bacterium]
MRRKKGFFSISAVAEMFSIHQQTIRLYEKEGLICPKRTEGKTRQFSEDDIEKLEEIVYLTHHMGINIAGVEMILKLRKQIKKLQKDMNTVFEQATEDLTKQEEATKSAIKESANRLMVIKQKAIEQCQSNPTSNDSDTESEGWEIEYED